MYTYIYNTWLYVVDYLIQTLNIIMEIEIEDPLLSYMYNTILNIFKQKEIGHNEYITLVCVYE